MYELARVRRTKYTTKVGNFIFRLEEFRPSRSWYYELKDLKSYWSYTEDTFFFRHNRFAYLGYSQLPPGDTSLPFSSLLQAHRRPRIPDYAKDIK